MGSSNRKLGVRKSEGPSTGSRVLLASMNQSVDLPSHYSVDINILVEGHKRICTSGDFLVEVGHTLLACTWPARTSRAKSSANVDTSIPSHPLKH
jgi:hypothetical protein